MANAFIRDISERRATAERIAAGERFVRGIADNVPALVSYIDRDERYTFANAHILRRHPGETLIGRTMRDVRGQEVYAKIERWVRRALKGEAVTFIIPESDLVGGADLVYEVNYIPDRGADDTVNGFYSLSIDITQRKRSEEALQASEKRFRSVTDNMPALVSYLDTEERFAFANAAFKDWFGLEPERIIGKTLREVVGDAVYEPRAPMLTRAFAGERVEFDTHRVVDGSARDVHSIYVPDLGLDGKCNGVFALSLNITSLKNIERALAAQARVDTLTGLPNRLALNEALPMSIARAKRNGCALALMFLDIDRFKTINDTHGHAVGDQVLVEFARRLRDAVRVTDTVARLAGDEFVVLLESPLDEAAAAQVARKIVALVGEAPFVFQELRLAVTTSVGVAFHATSDAFGPDLGEQLMQRADTALYRAKAAGRNSFVLVANKDGET